MTRQRKLAFGVLGGVVVAALATCLCTPNQKTPKAVDPGVRGGAPGAGTALPGLTADETTFFQDGLSRFLEIEVVMGGGKQRAGASL
jgi:hypothetical protein